MKTANNYEIHTLIKNKKNFLNISELVKETVWYKFLAPIVILVLLFIGNSNRGIIAFLFQVAVALMLGMLWNLFVYPKIVEMYWMKKIKHYEIFLNCAEITNICENEEGTISVCEMGQKDVDGQPYCVEYKINQKWRSVLECGQQIGVVRCNKKIVLFYMDQACRPLFPVTSGKERPIKSYRYEECAHIKKGNYALSEADKTAIFGEREYWREGLQREAVFCEYNPGLAGKAGYYRSEKMVLLEKETDGKCVERVYEANVSVPAGFKPAVGERIRVVEYDGKIILYHLDENYDLKLPLCSYLVEATEAK